MTLWRMDEHLTHFIMKARRQDGLECPLNTLYQLTNLSVLSKRYLKENGTPEVTLLDEKWHELDKTRKVLDTRMKESTAKGVGTAMKSAHP